MAMLTHGFERPFRPSDAQQSATPGMAGAHLTTIKRACLFLLTVLLAGGALAAVIALKTAIYFWRYKLGAG